MTQAFAIRVLAAIVLMPTGAQAWDAGGVAPSPSRTHASAPVAPMVSPQRRDCKPPTEFTPQHCALRLPKIAGVIVVQNGARSSPEAQPEAPCTKFRLSAMQVTAFLRGARQVPSGEAQHDMDWSPCFAKGHVTFVDGSHAEWLIDMFGGGSLMTDGADRPIPLYCPTCTRKPFVR